MCQAHEEVWFSPYLSQVNTTEIKISRQLKEKVARSFFRKKMERFIVQVKTPIYFLRKSGFIMD